MVGAARRDPATRRGCAGGCMPQLCASTWRAPRRTRRCRGVSLFCSRACGAQTFTLLRLYKECILCLAQLLRFYGQNPKLLRYPHPMQSICPPRARMRVARSLPNFQPTVLRTGTPDREIPRAGGMAMGRTAVYRSPRAETRTSARSRSLVRHAHIMQLPIASLCRQTRST